ncbi:MAG: hypothetical protein IT323_13430 [Anaerolineae bacterium]|nr:hypothetical protein [Anaerolineae bacterium]
MSSALVSGAYSMYLRGEICSGMDVPVSGLEVAANLFSGDQFTATGRDYLSLSPLLPGEFTCFEIEFPLGTPWTRYEFEPVSYYTYKTTRPAMGAHSLSGSYNPSMQRYELIGMVRNDSQAVIQYPRAVITFYNAARGVVSCYTQYANANSLAPGQSSAFSVTLYGAWAAEIASFRVQAMGHVF